MRKYSWMRPELVLDVGEGDFATRAAQAEASDDFGFRISDFGLGLGCVVRRLLCLPLLEFGDGLGCGVGAVGAWRVGVYACGAQLMELGETLALLVAHV